jgi:hypothetical protein
VHIIDPDHPVKDRISENIVAGNEFNVRVAVDDHVIGDRDIGLGEDQDWKKQENQDERFHGFEDLGGANIRYFTTEFTDFHRLRHRKSALNSVVICVICG